MQGEENVQKSHDESCKSNTIGLKKPPQNSDEFEEEGGWKKTGSAFSIKGHFWPNK